MNDESILVVDDEPALLSLLRDLLAAEGHRVEVALGGREALTRLARARYDLLLLDLLMPDMDGLTVLRRAREVDPNVMAIMMTSWGTMENAVEALRAGARDFLLKPFEMEELHEAVDRALLARRRQQENLLMRACLPILEASQTLLAGDSTEPLPQRILNVAVQHLHASQALLLLLDQAKNELYVAGSVGLPAEAAATLHIPAEESSTAWLLEQRAPVVLEMPMEASGDPAWQPFTFDPGAVAASVPLRAGQSALGLLNLTCGRQAIGPAFSRADLNLLSIVSRQMAVALQNAHLYGAIARAKQEWETTFDAITDAVCLLDATGRIQRCNQATVDLLARPASEIVGQAYWEAVHGIADPIDGHPVTRVLRTGQRATMVLHTDDRWLRMTADPVLDDTGHPIGAACILADITGQVRCEDTHCEREERLAAFLRHLPGVAYIKDLSGRYVYVNAETKPLPGLKLDDLPGETVEETWPAEAAARLTDHDQRVIETGTPQVQVETVTQEDGFRDWLINKFPILDRAGRIALIGAIGLDISERVRAEQAFQESMAALDRAQRIAGFGYWDWKSPDGTLYWSDEMYRLFGRSREMGPPLTDWRECIHPDDRADTIAVLEAALLGQSPHCHEFRVVHSDGCEHVIHAEAEVLHDDSGLPIRVIGIALDITQRVQAERERQRLHEELQRRADELERRVDERTSELQEFVNLLAGREIRMAELKQVIRRLRTQLQAAGLEPVADDPLAAGID